VVTRSVEAPDVVEEITGQITGEIAEGDRNLTDESPDVVPDATIESGATSHDAPESDPGPAVDPRE